MWNELTSVPDSNEVLGPWSIAALVLFSLVFIAAGFFSARPWARPLGEHYSRRFVERWTRILGWISGVGLFLVIIRYLQINPVGLGLPIWTVMTLAALGMAIIVMTLTSAADRAARRLHKAGHRPSQIARRPVRRRR